MVLAEPGKISGSGRVLLICPDGTMKAEILPLLSKNLPLTPVLESPVYPPQTVLAEVMASQPPDMCFLDASSDRSRALALITEILTLRASTQIVVLLSSNDPDLILRSLRTGGSEFLVAPFNDEQLQGVIERLARLQPGSSAVRQDLGKVYCIMPAKGACGASTVACNLAFQWKRLGAKRILLADLDPLTGTQAFLLKLKSTFSFVDAVSRAGNLDADLWKALVAVSSGVDILLSPDNPVDGIQSLQDPTSIVEYARQAYDAVILDAGSAYGEWSLTLARLCDELLLVATNELPALQATQRVLAYLDRNRVDRGKVRLVINRFDRDTGLSREMVETALHTDVYHVLPNDYDAVQKALIEGRLIPSASSFGKSLSALANRLAGREEKRPTAGGKAPGLGGLLSLFWRST